MPLYQEAGGLLTVLAAQGGEWAVLVCAEAREGRESHLRVVKYGAAHAVRVCHVAAAVLGVGEGCCCRQPRDSEEGGEQVREARVVDVHAGQSLRVKRTTDLLMRRARKWKGVLIKPQKGGSGARSRLLSPAVNRELSGPTIQRLQLERIGR